MAADYVRECERCGHKLTAGDMKLPGAGVYLRYREWVVCRVCHTELMAPLKKGEDK